MAILILQIDTEKVRKRFVEIFDLFGSDLEKQIDTFNQCVKENGYTLPEIEQIFVSVQNRLGKVHRRLLRGFHVWTFQELNHPFRGALVLFEQNLITLKKRSDISEYKAMLRDSNQFFQLLAEIDIRASFEDIGGNTTAHNPVADSNNDFDIRAAFTAATINADVKWIFNDITKEHGENLFNAIQLLSSKNIQSGIRILMPSNYLSDKQVIEGAIQLEEMLSLYQTVGESEAYEVQITQGGAIISLKNEIVEQQKEERKKGIKDKFVIQGITIDSSFHGLSLVEYEEEYNGSEFSAVQSNFRNAATKQLPRQTVDEATNAVFIGTELPHVLDEVVAVLYGKDVEFGEHEFSTNPEGFFSDISAEGEPGLGHVPCCVFFNLRFSYGLEKNKVSIIRKAWPFFRKDYPQDKRKTLNEFAKHYTTKVINVD